MNKGDKVLLSDGKYGIIIKVKTKELENPETTYNFEVADYHTYYVGESGILVHNNNCNTYDIDKLVKTQPKEYINEGTVNNMMESIQANGPSAVKRIPIHIDKNGRALVVDGHHRLEAFSRLGYQRVPIQYIKASKLGVGDYRSLADLLAGARFFGGG